MNEQVKEKWVEALKSGEYKYSFDEIAVLFEKHGVD